MCASITAPTSSGMSGKSFKEVSEQVGFENYSYFGKLFKKYIGQTPETYRGGVTGEFGDIEGNCGVVLLFRLQLELELLTVERRSRCKTLSRPMWLFWSGSPSCRQCWSSSRSLSGEMPVPLSMTERFKTPFSSTLARMRRIQSPLFSAEPWKIEFSTNGARPWKAWGSSARCRLF